MSTPRPLELVLATSAVLGVLALPAQAEAFCGFYVAGAGAELYNDATTVVLMRDGTRTVLSMQNNYRGPPEDFAMVVPVPVVLAADQVAVIDAGVFRRIDQLAAPRLVEYWEQDPCDPHSYEGEASCAGSAAPDERAVKVEARFAVGEYDVVILSANDSTALEDWLVREDYAIPEGAAPLLRPYVEAGSKFFVAKVDVSKVTFDARGNARLSPLRIHYDSPEFSLPIRLGLINAPAGAGGAQDLLVHVLAPGTRYRAANYPNITIPTNLDVTDEVRERFGEFYASLFDHSLAHGLADGPAAVVTEYAWSAGSCDPCAVEPLRAQELVTLGAGLLPSYASKIGAGMTRSELQSLPTQFVLTRLHARYDATSAGDDIVFEAAPPLQGGREWRNPDGQLERGASEDPDGFNAFQARYVIRHPWTAPIACAVPYRGEWGSPPPGADAPRNWASAQTATELAFVDRSAVLGQFVTAAATKELEAAVGPVEQLAPDADAAAAGASGDSAGSAGSDAGCAHCTSTAPEDPSGLLASFGLLGLAASLRRRRSSP